MIRKFTTIAAVAAAALMSMNAVHASHLGYKSTHIIGGKAYFFTLNFSALITSLTGRDIKDGTQLVADVKISDSDTACANPQTHRVMPGVGPKGNVVLTSEPLSESDVLDKNDREKRNIFATTATSDALVPAEFRLRDDLGLCKETAGTQWVQMFWEDKSPPCIKGQATGNTCYGAYTASTGYTRLAVWMNNSLTIVPSSTALQCTRTLKTPAPAAGEDPYNYFGADCENWTFVFLPTMFALKAYVTTAGVADTDSNTYYSCQFNINNDAGAPRSGEPYGIGNPPDAGWGGPVANAASYQCDAITDEQYAQYQ